ncbi:hypothetical protein [Chitinasiproducens palmae]|uniref:Flagellar protein FliT n=1 Tax=Chitinasiproducens palmae TaxID=1770053 RepID=A0A1H2PKI1_9BURK|nr:hypothetical protein [Chitinasiproducens palmae]SDV46940.1 hypothetical protein SAMN05216551_102120 [Chitinasiproducens palmae]
MHDWLAKAPRRGDAPEHGDATSIAARLESCLTEQRWDDANALIAQLDGTIAAELEKQRGKVAPAHEQASARMRLTTLREHCRACLGLTARHGALLAERLRALECTRPALSAYHCVERL